MKNISLLILITFILGDFVHAQEKIISDRVGFGSSTFSIPSKTYQLETGISISDNEYEIGQLLLRTGIGNQLELRVSAGSVVYNTDSESNSVSLQAIGLKYTLNKRSDYLDLAVNGNFEFPGLTQDLDDRLYSFFILADYSSWEKFAINSSFGYGNVLEEIGNGTTYFSTTPGYVINPKNEVAAGIILEITDFSELTGNSFFEIGFTHYFNELLNGDIQIITDGSNSTIVFGISTQL